MRIRGISFAVPQGQPDVLRKIFKDIHPENYFWYNVREQCEAWYIPQNDWFLDDGVYAGEDFCKEIDAPQQIFFIKLQAYYKPECFENISTYDDFCRCENCLLLLLMYDCEQVEIYTKESDMAHRLFHSAAECNYFSIQFITDENDGRVHMNIL